MRTFIGLLMAGTVLAVSGTLALAANYNVLYSFSGGNDGADPNAGLAADKSGNLYGTTVFGGSDNCNGVGCGTVFKIAADGTETVLHSFAGGSDGTNPYDTLLVDSSGNLYGTTSGGGGTQCGGFGCGTIFKLAPNGTETVLYSFAGGNDGASPVAGLIADAAGNLYGTTLSGGAHGLGTIVRLAPDGTEAVLYSFTGGNDGDLPWGGVIEDKKGNLYGTTQAGGSNMQACGNSGCGAVFKLQANGTFKVLYDFTGGTDGGFPYSGLLADSTGALYGTTYYGGTGTSCSGNCGVVFKVTTKGTETVLYSFTGASDGANPSANLIADKKGNLYSTTYDGGTAGTVFKLSAAGVETTLHGFGKHRDGADPGGPVLSIGRYLYGTTEYGGTGSCRGGCGTVFKVEK